MFEKKYTQKEVDRLLAVARENVIGETLQRKNSEIETLKHSHALELNKIESEHSIALKEKDFEMTHHENEKIDMLMAENSQLKTDTQVLAKENEMLDKMTDTKVDVQDIKSILSSVIEKLPSINISGAALSTKKEE